MKVDLHNHTLHSDGVYTCRQLIERAVHNGVDVFALTDHDSVFGIDEIMELSKEYPVKVIPGMELSTFYKGENVHIICLFKKGIVPQAIRDFSVQIRESRRNRSIKMLENVERIYGLKVDIPAVLKDAEVLTRGNMLRHLMKMNDMTRDEAWKYLDSSSLAYVPSGDMSTKEGIEFIRENDLFCILAHPGLIKKREYVTEILEYGFDGIEAYYPSHTKEDIEYFKSLAEKYNLVISGGSDCHGYITNGDKAHGDIGTSYIDEELFNIIYDKIK